MATRKSTNINELPSLNSLANQTDEDDAIAEVLEEIESFRKKNPDMWPKCNYLEELVKENKKFN